VDRKRGLSEELALWLGSNLVPDARGRLVWSFNVQGAAAMYQSYRCEEFVGGEVRSRVSSVFRVESLDPEPLPRPG